MKTQNAVPFIVARRAGWYNGRKLFAALGVEMATCKESAFEKAHRRWPHWSLYLAEPEHWEDVEPEIRLLALEADRQM